MRKAMIAVALACLAAPISAPISAQDTADPQTDAQWLAWVPAAEMVEMPALVFEESERTAADYNQFFYFHRADTTFATALADLRACDGFSRDLSREGNSSFAHIVEGARRGGRAGGGALGAPLGGALGGAIGRSIAQGPAEREELRKKYRINIRRCMFLSGYARYGLTERLWKDLAFDIADDDLTEEERQRSLLAQARAASAGLPVGAMLGL